MAFPLIGALGGLVRVASLGAFFRGLTKWALLWVGPLLLQGLAFFGLAMVTQDYALGPLVSELSARMSGAPSTFVEVFAYVGGDKAITYILSAYIVRAAGRIFLRRVP